MGVQASVSVGLAADVEYFFRVEASNVNGTNPGEPGQNKSFVTPGPGVHSVFASAVSASSATLNTRIDPNNAPTSFYFQYSTGPLSECGAAPAACLVAPAAPGEGLGSGKGDVAGSVHIQGLAPGSVYHYRVVALSSLETQPGITEPVQFPGQELSFKTQATGEGFVLPDARQWELVTPPNKHGAVPFPLGFEPATLKASVSGDAVSYAVTVPTEAGTQGYGEGVQVLSSRTPDGGGWVSADIGVAHSGAIGAGLGTGLEYRDFSEDLSVGLVEPQGPFASLAPHVFPPDSERTPYLRHNLSCASEPGSCFEPLVTSATGFSDVPEHVKFGGGERIVGEANFVGASADLSHVILDSRAQLTATVTNGADELYEWDATTAPTERLKLVSQLNNKQTATHAAGLGFEGENARGAISADGSRVVWSELGGGIYLTDTVLGRTVRLDTIQGGTGSGAVLPMFQIASADGSKVFFTDTQRLTSDSGAKVSEPDLYVCEITETTGEPACELEDLTPLNGQENANVQGVVLGASEDGKWIYYTTNGMLANTASEGAKPGHCETINTPAGASCNLYVMHDGEAGWEEPKLITVLSAQDYSNWGGESPGNLVGLTARVSPDGSWLAFMSEREQTGYDNHDAVSGEPDQEAYLYHNNPTATSTLACVSCNPTGAQPAGIEYAIMAEGITGGDSAIWNQDQWIAASLPGWTPYSVSKAVYQSRYLSNQGRLFFDSHDALVPQDINNNQDVYEYEPLEVGSCTTSTPSYTETTHGCVSLISPGTASGESAFIDASENGNDVFFLTNERLTPQDTDTGLDLYDAHTCTTTSPCPTETLTPPSCTTAEACRPAPSPQPSIFGAPSSSTFSGPSNLAPAGTAIGSIGKPKPRSLTRAQKLAAALKLCRTKKGKHKRRPCERLARKKYGPATSRKAS